jgi:DNA-binding XRE family transcriptional regulator
MTATAVLPHAFDPGALRRARRDARLTLEQAGAAVGKHWLSVQRYEVGRVDPPLPVLVSLAAVYGVHPGDLFVPRM